MGKYAFRFVAGLTAAWILAGCGQKPIEDYRVSKENGPEVAGPGPMAAQASPASGEPGAPTAPASVEKTLRWGVPKGWQARPGEGMRYATFVIPGKAGASAEMSVVVLPGDAGGELANINRWRGQIGLPPLDDKALGQESMRVKSVVGMLLVVDCVGISPQDNKKTRLLGAILPWNERTWFFKLLGPEPAVAAAKPGFLHFLEGLH